MSGRISNVVKCGPRRHGDYLRIRTLDELDQELSVDHVKPMESESRNPEKSGWACATIKRRSDLTHIYQVADRSNAAATIALQTFVMKLKSSFSIVSAGV